MTFCAINNREPFRGQTTPQPPDETRFHWSESLLEAHIFALYEEHLYLQEAMNRLYSENFEVATLIKANRSDDRDLQLFLKGGIGLFLLEEERVATARRVLAELKVGGKR